MQTILLIFEQDELLMFITLLIVTFLLAVIVSWIVVRIFGGSFTKILNRLIEEDISESWIRYLKFAIYVVGISSGVRVWQLERYIDPAQLEKAAPLVLNTDRWVLELYRTIIGSLQGIAWLLLVFYIVALMAYLVVKLADYRREMKNG